MVLPRRFLPCRDYHPFGTLLGHDFVVSRYPVFLTRRARAQSVHIIGLARRCSTATGLDIDAIGDNAGSWSVHVAGATVIDGHTPARARVSCSIGKVGSDHQHKKPQEQPVDRGVWPSNRLFLGSVHALVPGAPTRHLLA